MPKPVVIFGAGASYDVIDTGEFNVDPAFRSPLTNQLLDKKWDPYFLHKYKWLNRLINRVRQSIKKGRNLEDFLREFKEAIETFNPQIRRETTLQLIEFQLFLKELFSDISDRYINIRGAIKTSNGSVFRNHDVSASTNYVTFLDESRKYFDGGTIITFNYDLFLDRAFEKVFEYTFNSISDYSSNPYRLYKIHGSVNWFSPATKPTIKADSYAELIFEATNSPTYVQREVEITEKSTVDLGINIQIPCLAIPLPQDKKFIIPAHCACVENDLKEADRLIVIGWSAGDEYFVKKIKENIVFGKARLVIIDETEEKAQKIAAKLNCNEDREKLWDEKNIFCFGGGFSGIWGDQGIFEKVFK